MESEDKTENIPLLQINQAEEDLDSNCDKNLNDNRPAAEQDLDTNHDKEYTGPTDNGPAAEQDLDINHDKKYTGPTDNGPAAEQDLDTNYDKKYHTGPTAEEDLENHVKEKWRRAATFICLWLTYLMCSMAYSLLAPFFPAEVKKKGFSSFWTGVIVGCAPLSVVFLSPLFGYILPLFRGVKCMMFSGLVIIGGAYISLSFSDLLPSSWIFVLYASIARVIEGVGTGMFTTAIFSILPDLFPNSVATIMGWIEVAGSLGYAIGPPIGGVLYHLGGFKVPFISVGVLVLILALPCVLLIKKKKELKDSSKKSTISCKILLSVFTDLVFILLVLSNILALIFIGFFAPILQPFLSEQFNLSPLYVGLVFLISPATYLVTAIIVGPLSDKLGYRWFVVFGLMPVSVGFFLAGPAQFIASPRLWLTCVAFVIIGISAAISFIPVYADLLETAKKILDTKDEGDVKALIATVSGVVASATFLGQFLGPVISGGMAEVLSFPTSSFIFGEVILAQAFLLMGVTLIRKYT